MSREGKTRRRLFYLLTGTLILTSLAGGGALYRLHYIKQKALQGRTDGLVSMEHGDYRAALAQLGKYLSRYPNDVEILLPYAKARRLVEETNNRNIGQAISLYQRILELKPDEHEAENSLLDLYVGVGYFTEALTLADSMLAKSPDDTKALRIKTISLASLQRLKEAEDCALRLTTLEPTNLDFQIIELNIMIRRGKQENMQAYADQLMQAHPGDVHFELLKVISAIYAADSATALKWIKPLVTRPLPDAAYTAILVQKLDQLSLYADAFTVLQSCVKENSDPLLHQLWIRRLYETNRLSMLLDQTATLDPGSSTSDPELIGLRSLALTRLNRPSDAKSLLDALEKRGHTDSSAEHWFAAVNAASQTDADPVTTLNLIRDALVANPESAILFVEMGDALVAAGAGDKAFSAWNQALTKAPEWSVPLERISKAMLSGGRRTDALAAAQAAVARAPQEREALMSLAVASAANFSPGSAGDTAKLLAMIDDLQRRFPSDFEVPSLKAGILAQSQQLDASVQVIRSVLAANPAPSEQVLISFAMLSEAFKLGLEENCFDLSLKANGLSPRLAFARAHWLANQKRVPEGLALLEQARTGHADDLVWRNLWATYLDQVADARAKTEWITLADANPKNVRIQWAALGAAAVQTDHEFIGTTITRLTDLLGQDSVSLRLARARWFLQGQPSENDVTQASILLSEIVRIAPQMLPARQLLVACYLRLNNVDGAIDQLTAAVEIPPQQASTSLELARLLQTRGDFPSARKYIDRAVGSDPSNVDVARRAASLLALQGDSAAALTLLEKTSNAANSQAPDLVLAALYRQANQVQKTDEQCRRLLQTPDSSIVAFCADFYASQDRLDDAQNALKLLDSLKLPVAAAEMIRADYYAHYGTPSQVIAQFQAAANAAPNEIIVWQQFVAYYLGNGKIDEALATAEEAALKIPNASTFDPLRKNANLVKEVSHIIDVRQLLIMLAGPPAGSDPALEALHIIANAQQKKDPAMQIATKLRQVADRNPRLLPLQNITLQFYMDAGQIEEAVSLAHRTIQAFPAAVEPVRLATSVMGAAQQWDQALGAAKEWRRLMTTEKVDADLAIAAAELHLNNPNAASQQIQPYLQRAAQDPDKYGGVILLRAESLLATHQFAEVESLLNPLLKSSPKWRSLWLTFAVRMVDDPNRAQAWLSQVESLMEASIDEKTSLAQARMAIGQRWKLPELEQIGRAQLQAIIAAPDTPIGALLSWGTLCESRSDWSGAEHAYRQALQRDAANSIALNNLAYVLVQKNGSLDEARQFITKALEVSPNRPAFLDTKATVLAAMKDYAGAESTIKEASKLDPQNITWHINLLSILVDAGKTSAARTELQQISPSRPNLPPDLQQRFDALSAKLH